jgi:heme/copper-type cytochrome/quinol oxidase subunit 2
VNQVAQSFTVPNWRLKVPIPVATAPADPAVMTFTFHAPESGSFTWQREAPCGSGSSSREGLATSGWMTGTVTVSNA